MKFSDRIAVRLAMETDPDGWPEMDQEDHDDEIGQEQGWRKLRFDYDHSHGVDAAVAMARLEAEDAVCPPPRTQQLRPELELRIVDEDAWEALVAEVSAEEAERLGPPSRRNKTNHEDNK